MSENITLDADLELRKIVQQPDLDPEKRSGPVPIRAKSSVKPRSVQTMVMGKRIIETAMENGATLAGIASVKAIKVSASHTIYTKMGDYAGIGTVKDDALPGNQLFAWPDSVKSVLVIGLSHPKDKPELDGMEEEHRVTAF